MDDDEQIEEGDYGDEDADVAGEQAPANWSEQPNSDAGLTPGARERLGLA
jgi:hypothetical protein